VAAAKYRLARTDYRYGHTCPVCAGPKSVQAARCAGCYADSLVIHGRSRKGVITPRVRKPSFYSYSAGVFG
jgi:hypothetical protein